MHPCLPTVLALIASASAFSVTNLGPNAALARRTATPRMEPSAEPEGTDITETKVEEPRATFSGAAFADGPSDDPMMTCFLAPDYMGAASASKWVCLPFDQLAKVDSTYAENSY